jgi:hypothetical protein
MSGGNFLSWDEMQRLALPPNTAMLVPPPPELTEVPALAAGPPKPQPDWLDDAFVANADSAAPVEPLALNTPTVADPSAQRLVPQDPDAERAAAERAEYGPGPVRLITNLITVNALLEFAQSPRKEEDEEERPPRKLPETEPKP